MSRLSPPTEPSREWNCNLKLNVAWSAGKTFLFLEKMSTRNLQPTPKMISKSSVPIDLFTAGCVENLGTDPGLKDPKTTAAQLVLVEVLSHPFRSTVEVKREILAIFHILLEALQPHLSQLKYYVSRQITVYSEARSSVLRYRIKFKLIAMLISFTYGKLVPRVRRLGWRHFICYTVLTSPKKGETSVHGCNPTLSVSVVLVSRKVDFFT